MIRITLDKNVVSELEGLIAELDLQGTDIIITIKFVDKENADYEITEIAKAAGRKYE